MDPVAFDRLMMQRCLDLAIRGRGRVSPNPLVGCVIVYDGKIIGEGFHQRFKGLHAEIEAIRSVDPADHHLFSESTIYVSLEPCFHQGHNPPCVDEILRQRFKRVVIGELDPNPLVNGQSLKKLEQAGIQVATGLLASESKEIQAPFLSRMLKQRPYIVLKWAQSSDGQLGIKQQSLSISNAISKTLSHKWRTEIDAILIGIGTAITDLPQLTPRLYPGRSPVRIVLDPNSALPMNHPLLQGPSPTLVFRRDNQGNQTQYAEFVKVKSELPWLEGILNELQLRGISSLLVEGGPSTLRTFIRAGLWDEVWFIKAPTHLGEGGLPAPEFSGQLIDKIHCGTDEIMRFRAQTR